MTPEQPTAPAPGSVTSGGKHEAKRSGPHHTPEEVAKALREPLPVCPYDQRSPDYWTTPDDKPCVVCGQANDVNAPSLCRGADTRVYDRAADLIERLIQERDRAQAEAKGLREALTGVVHWATTRCPCGPPDYGYDEPKICPLCQADVDDPASGECRAVEETFPRDLLRRARSALGGGGLE